MPESVSCHLGMRMHFRPVCANSTVFHAEGGTNRPNGIQVQLSHSPIHSPSPQVATRHAQWKRHAMTGGYCVARQPQRSERCEDHSGQGMAGFS